MMSDIQLPSEWRETTLECVGVVVTGKTPSKKNPDFFSGTIPFIKPGDVNDQGVITHTEEHLTDLGAATVPTIPLGAVVVTCIGNLGRCAITSELSATNQQINSVIPDSGVNVSFIYYQLRTLKEWMLSESSATTVTIINKSKFSQAPIVLPPLAEQKVIADKLDTLLAQVETTKARLERIPEILKSFRQSVLSAAVSGKLTEEWRDLVGCALDGSDLLNEVLVAREKSWRVKGKYKKPAELYDSLNLSLPQSWIETTLDSLVDSNRPICYGILMPKDNVENGILYVKVRDMKGDIIDLSSLQRTSKEIAEKYSRSSLIEGDLLLSIRGTYGRLATIPKELNGGNITQDSARVAVTSLVNSAYIKYVIRSQPVQRYLQSKARGVAVKGVNIGDVRPMPIPLPPLDEQTEIVSRVEELFAFADSIEQKATAALLRVNNLTQSILAKAFRGELTADWRAANPELISGDNSAAALLEKIKAERAALAPLKKSRASKKV